VRVLFAGFGELGAAVLEPLIGRHQVAAVLTHPAAFTGLTGAQVQDIAERAAIPVYLSAGAAEADLAGRLAELDAEVLVSTNWRTRLPKPILAAAALGAINVHDSLLPGYAGFGAVNWVIRDGGDHTGLTVHFMDDQLDTGAILLQTRVDIGPDEDATSVYHRLVAQYGPAALEALDLVAQGDRGQLQNLTGASLGHRITADDTRIDWTWDTASILNLIRAQSSPFLNAWCLSDGQRLSVGKAAMPARSVRGTPGRVVAAAEGGVLIACGRPGDQDSRGVILRRVTPEGESEQDAAEYFSPVRGARYLQ
jgi:methionyl-tRNA formyltransferase